MTRSSNEGCRRDFAAPNSEELLQRYGHVIILFLCRSSVRATSCSIILCITSTETSQYHGPA